MTRRPFPGLSLFLLPLLAVALGAQKPAPTIVLDNGAKEFAEPFSKVGRVVELRDGRLVLTDAVEKEIRLVDMTRGTMTAIGRQGGGPLEYRMPGALLPGSVDTVQYYDLTQGRVLLISADGKPVRTIAVRGGDLASMITGVQLRRSDARGRVYGETMGMTVNLHPTGATPEMPEFADSVEIKRIDLATGKATTIAWIKSEAAQLDPKIEMVGSGIKITATAPDFSPADAWTALPDGRIAMLRHGDYRIEFVVDGKPRVFGPRIPFTPIPVTAKEKRAVMDSLRQDMDTSMAMMNKNFSALPAGAGGKPVSVPKMEAVMLEPKTWAATKSPYVDLSASPDGRIWVTTTRPTGVSALRYDVLDGNGALLAHLQLAEGELLVGLGQGTVYTVRKDADDLQYLRRYLLPKLP